jgi:hypothetical protein
VPSFFGSADRIEIEEREGEFSFLWTPNIFGVVAYYNNYG